jgi:hypothetical protein
LAAQCHHLSSRAANSGTFQVGLNALGHVLNVFFLQAGSGAMVTGGDAFPTGVNTALKFFVSHVLIFFG